MSMYIAKANNVLQILIELRGGVREREGETGGQRETEGGFSAS